MRKTGYRFVVFREAFSPTPTPVIHGRRQAFSIDTSAFANLSDRLVPPESKLLDESRHFGYKTVLSEKHSKQQSVDQPNSIAFESTCFTEKDWVVFQESDTPLLSVEESDEAWDLFQKYHSPESISLEPKLKTSRSMAKLNPVFTPASSLPVSTWANVAALSYDKNALPDSTSLGSEFATLDWRTRAKSQVKNDYSQLPNKTRKTAGRLNDSRSTESEEDVWSLLFEKQSDIPATRSKIVCQARTVDADPYIQEATRYIDSWSKVMEFERDNEAMTAMKRLYDIRRKSGSKYNPPGKSLVDMVVTIVEPPENVKPAQKNDVFVRLERADESELGLCNFRNGDHLLLSAESEKDFGDMQPRPVETLPKLLSKNIFIPCRLVVKRTYHLILRLEDNDVELDSQTYRLDYGWDGTSFDRMSAALNAIQDDPDALRKNMSAKELERGGVKVTGSSLRHSLLFTTNVQSTGTEQSPTDIAPPPFALNLFTRDQRINSWAQRHLRHPPLKMAGDPDLGYLNEPQTRAIAMAISSSISLIQGPPGTGKTRTIIQMVALLKIHFQVSQSIVVCAPTHVSVDNLVAGLLAAGLKPVRCGDNLKVAPDVAPYSLENLEADHPLTPTIEKKNLRLESLAKDLDAIEKRWRKKDLCPLSPAKKKPDNSKQCCATAEFKRFSYEVYMLKRRRQQQIMESADVICCTCLGAGTTGLEAVEFASVIIDEAAMCHEPAALIPLTKGSAHTVLVGDHKQLPAITLSPEAVACGFGISLFERLKNQQNVPSILLHKQYRMHPTISAFPNAEFYHHELVDSIDPKIIKPVFFHFETSLLLTENRAKAVSFVTHNHCEIKIERTLMNKMEAEIVLSILRDLLRTNPGLTGRDIGIIAPYRGQVGLLQSLQRQPQKASLIRNLEQSYRNEVEINTVDGFQGREKPVIILSCVRGNAERQIGFLADLRRFNVAATRAKQKLVVVGHLDTLQYANVGRYLRSAGHYDAEAWRRWVRWAQDEKLLIDSEKFRGR